jgi:hypothetical protein
VVTLGEQVRDNPSTNYYLPEIAAAIKLSAFLYREIFTRESAIDRLVDYFDCLKRLRGKGFNVL